VEEIPESRMLLLSHGLGVPSQTAQENQPAVRSGKASETAFLTVFDAAVLKGAGREGEVLVETMPEGGARGEREDIGNAAETPTEGDFESIPIGDMPSDTPVAEETGLHAHEAPNVENTAPAQTRRNPQSSPPSIPHAAEPASIVAKAPGRDVAQSGPLADVAPPPTTSYRPETDHQRASPEDKKQALSLPKSNKMHHSSAPVNSFETGASLRQDVSQAAGITTGQDRASTTPLENLPPAPEAGARVRSTPGHAMHADRIVQPLPAASLEANTIAQPAKGTAPPFNMEASVKNHGDHPHPRQSSAKPPQQTDIHSPKSAMPPAPAAAPIQVTAVPMFTPELTEETARSPAIPDDARADLRLTAEGGPRPVGPFSQTPQSSDLPRHVAQQIVEALQRGGGGKERGIDLLLNPAELGRVRISLSPGDAGLTVHIVADRPETLDLMRRHIDMLAQDFQSIGYEATDFAFAQHDHEAEDQGSNAAQPHTQHVTREAEVSSQITATIMTDRVDIRL